MSPLSPFDDLRLNRAASLGVTLIKGRERGRESRVRGTADRMRPKPQFYGGSSIEALCHSYSRKKTEGRLEGEPQFMLD